MPGTKAAATQRANALMRTLRRIFMSRTSKAILATSFALAVVRPAAAADSKAPRPAVALSPAQPDLVITSFGLKSWGTCAPNQTVFTFEVVVKNAGGATWSSGEPAVVVKDMHPGVLDAWGTGLGIDPPLKPGESRMLSVPVSYYSANPSHMTSAAPHPFRASVNDNHVVLESNFSNNAGP